MLRRVWRDGISILNLVAIVLLSLNEILLFRIVFKFLLNLNFKNKSCGFTRIRESQSLSERYLNASGSANMGLLQVEKRYKYKKRRIRKQKRQNSKSSGR